MHSYNLRERKSSGKSKPVISYKDAILNFNSEFDNTLLYRFNNNFDVNKYIRSWKLVYYLLVVCYNTNFKDNINHFGNLISKLNNGKIFIKDIKGGGSSEYKEVTEYLDMLLEHLWDYNGEYETIDMNDDPKDKNYTP